jgi:hypothetical protein
MSKLQDYEIAMRIICDECKNRHNMNCSYCDEQCMVREVWYNLLDERESEEDE